MSDFSVLMSVYAGESSQNITECLDSLVKQSLRANEVVLVQDGKIPTELKSVISEYREELNIVSIELESNSGLGAALNKGLEHCRFELVARMDTDDIALPLRFKCLVDHFQKYPATDIIGSYVLEFASSSDTGVLRRVPILHKSIVSNLFACPFIHPSVMFKKSSIQAIGGYNRELKRRQDYELWFRCAQADMRFMNIPVPLLRYRFTEKTHSKQSFFSTLEQGNIGCRSVLLLRQPIWKAVACYVPLIRSLLPSFIAHRVYRLLKAFDPRERDID